VQGESPGPSAEALWPRLPLWLWHPDVDGGGGHTSIRCMLQVYILNVSNILEVCCKCFHMEVAKVDQDVAYIAIVVHVCCKRLSQCFICFFRSTLQVCLSGCYICFTYMLQVFYLDVAYVCNGFQVFLGVFATVLYACFKCFICLQTYIASVESGCFKIRSGCCTWDVRGKREGRGRCLGGVGPMWAHEKQRPRTVRMLHMGCA
jgi:hypothetical protein